MFLKRVLSLAVLVSFVGSSIIGPNHAYAGDIISNLPAPGAMVNLSPSFEPMLMKGIKVHPENPFEFDFIIDTGHSGLKAKDTQLKIESERLIKYFLAAMTVPEKDLWVNLSPYEKNRMIADNLGQTEMGRDLLAQDYILKQLTASLIYPEKNLGKKFWDSVYAKAQQQFGTTQIPVNTFNKVWIVADRADVFERGNVAYVVGAHLKVMLEEDYTALNKRNPSQPLNVFSLHTLGSQIVREVVLPEIEKEVNTGTNFAPLRQMFYSMILASWYKMALKDAILTQIYGNQSKVKVGINSNDPAEKDKIFQRYLQAYKKGVFNYIKEGIDQATHQPMPKKYFSGGLQIMLANTPGKPSILNRIKTGIASVLVAGLLLSVNASTAISQLKPSPNLPIPTLQKQDTSMTAQDYINGFRQAEEFSQFYQLENKLWNLIEQNHEPGLLDMVTTILKFAIEENIKGGQKGSWYYGLAHGINTRIIGIEKRDSEIWVEVWAKNAGSYAWERWTDALALDIARDAIEKRQKAVFNDWQKVPGAPLFSYKRTSGERITIMIGTTKLPDPHKVTYRDIDDFKKAKLRIIEPFSQLIRGEGKSIELITRSGFNSIKIDELAYPKAYQEIDGVIHEVELTDQEKGFLKSLHDFLVNPNGLMDLDKWYKQSRLDEVNFSFDNKQNRMLIVDPTRPSLIPPQVIATLSYIPSSAGGWLLSASYGGDVIIAEMPVAQDTPMLTREYNIHIKRIAREETYNRGTTFGKVFFKITEKNEFFKLLSEAGFSPEQLSKIYSLIDQENFMVQLWTTHHDEFTYNDLLLFGIPNDGENQFAIDFQTDPLSRTVFRLTNPHNQKSISVQAVQAGLNILTIVPDSGMTAERAREKGDYKKPKPAGLSFFSLNIPMILSFFGPLGMQFHGPSSSEIDTIARLRLAVPRATQNAPVVEHQAQIQSQNPGGIDLDRNKLNMNVSKDVGMGGVNVKFDKAMIERIQRDGYDGLNFKVNSILPTSLPILLGLQQRKEDEELKETKLG